MSEEASTDEQIVEGFAAGESVHVIADRLGRAARYVEHVIREALARARG